MKSGIEVLGNKYLKNNKLVGDVSEQRIQKIAMKRSKLTVNIPVKLLITTILPNLFLRIFLNQNKKKLHNNFLFSTMTSVLYSTAMILMSRVKNPEIMRMSLTMVWY